MQTSFKNVHKDNNQSFNSLRIQYFYRYNLFSAKQLPAAELLGILCKFRLAIKAGQLHLHKTQKKIINVRIIAIYIYAAQFYQ